VGVENLEVRLAREDEATAIESLMKQSIAALFPRHYSATQTASAIRFVASVDEMLIADQTYFVVEASDGLAACGGWSRRDKLYTGSGDSAADTRLLDPVSEPARVRAMFTRGDWARKGLGTRILQACEAAARTEGFKTLALVATLPGFELYLRYGFIADERSEVRLPDGETLACVTMHKPVE